MAKSFLESLLKDTPSAEKPLDRNNIPIFDAVTPDLLDRLKSAETKDVDFSDPANRVPGIGIGINPRTGEATKAKGPYQFMPDTAKRFGLDDKTVWDPILSRAAAKQYMDLLYNQFGDIQLALAGYNWGEGSVQKWLDAGADPETMPKETKDYIAKITGKSIDNPLSEYAAKRMQKGLSGPELSHISTSGTPGKYATSGEDTEDINKGGLNSPIRDALNSFWKGIDATQQGGAKAKLFSAENVLNSSPKFLKDLDQKLANGEISQGDYSTAVDKHKAELEQAVKDADDAKIEISKQQDEMDNEFVSKKYQAISELTNSQGSDAAFWDKMQYGMPQTMGSSAAFMGTEMAAAYGTPLGEAALVAMGTPVGAAAAIATAGTLAALGYSRYKETEVEAADAEEQNRAALMEVWMKEHPNSQPDADQLRELQLQARKGIDDLKFMNYLLAVPEVVGVALMPGANFGETVGNMRYIGKAAKQVSSLNKEIKMFGETFKNLGDLNKYTRLGVNLGKLALESTKERVEEGYQYAQQLKALDAARDLGLYEDKGTMLNVMTDAWDVLNSINYSPIGVIRNSDGRYSMDPQFQTSEEAGGYLGLLPGGVMTAAKIGSDFYTYHKINKVIGANFISDPEAPHMKMKAEVYADAFKNDNVHHLIQGLKTYSQSKDAKGNPMMTEEDLGKEINNIKIAYDRFTEVKNYINNVGGKMFIKPELKAAKAMMTERLFQSVLEEGRYDGLLSEDLKKKEAVLSKNTSPEASIVDLYHQKRTTEALIQEIENLEKVEPESAKLYATKTKKAVLKNNLKEIDKALEGSKDILPEDEVLLYTIKHPELDALIDINNDYILNRMYKDKWVSDRAELRGITKPAQAISFLKEMEGIVDAQKKNIIKKEAEKEAAKKTAGASRETVQKIGTTEEYDIIGNPEGEEHDGILSYKIAVKEGDKTVEKTVSNLDGFYRTPSGDMKKFQDGKYRLHGKDHFLNPLKYNYSQEENRLTGTAETGGVLSAERKKSENKDLSDAELREKVLNDPKYKNTFPAHKLDRLIDKILRQDDWKSHFEFIAEYKYVDKNKELFGENPIVWENESGLKGQRNEGIDILLQVTDPETKEKFDLFHPTNPEYLVIPGKKTFGTLTPAEFRKYFVNNSFGNAERETDFTDEDIKHLQETWKRLNAFKQAVINLKLPAGTVLKKSYYSLDVTPTLDYISDPEVPYSNLGDIPLLADAPIYYVDRRDPSLSGWITEKSGKTAPNYIGQNDPGSGYYVEITLPNGKAGVHKIYPAKTADPENKKEIKDKIVTPFNKVVQKLAEFKGSSDKTAKLAKGEIEKLGFFIAGTYKVINGKESGYKVTFEAVRPNLPNSTMAQESYVLTARINNFDTGVNQTVYFNAVSKDNNLITYNLNGKDGFDILAKLSRPFTEAEDVNTTILSNEKEFELKDIKLALPRDLAKKKKGSIPNLHSQFVVNLTPQVYSKINLKFDFNPAEAEKDGPVKKATAPTPKTAPKPVVTPPAEPAKPSAPSSTKVRFNPNGDDIVIEPESTNPSIFDAVPIPTDEEIKANEERVVMDSDEFLAEQNKKLTPEEKSAAKLKAEKDRENDDNAFKISKTSFISTPVTASEQLDLIRKQLPPVFTRGDIETLFSNTAEDGITVGAVVDRIIYLRNVADISDVYHENFHVVFRNLLSRSKSQAYINKLKRDLNYSPAEIVAKMATLKAQLIQRNEKFTNITDTDLENLVYEEHLADMFYEYIKNKKEPRSGLWQQFFDWLVSIINYMFTNNTDALFDKIERGGFKNSSIKNTSYNSSFINEAYKNLKLLNQHDSQALVRMIKNYVLNEFVGNDYEITYLALNGGINHALNFYNRNTEENKDFIDSIENPVERERVIQKMSDYYTTLQDSETQDIIKKEVNSYIKELGAKKVLEFTSEDTPIQSEQEAVTELTIDGEEDVSTDEESPDRVYDPQPLEVNPFDTSAARAIRKFMGTIEVTALDSIGKTIRVVLDPSTLYGKLLPIISNSAVHPSQRLAKLEQAANFNLEIKAFYDRFVKGIERDPDTGDLSPKGQELFNSLNAAFSVRKIAMNYTVAHEDEDKSRSSYANLNEGDDIFEDWTKSLTRELSYLFTDSVKTKTVLNTFENFIRIEKKSLQDIADFQRMFATTLGIDLPLDYLKYSYGIQEYPAFAGVYKLTDIDLANFLAEIRKGKNPLRKNDSGEGMLSKFRKISDASVKFGAETVMKTFKGSNNKPRFSYTVDNYILKTTDETINIGETSSEENNYAPVADLLAENNSFLSYNPLVEENNETAASNLANLRISYQTELRFNKDAYHSKDEYTADNVEAKELDTGSRIIGEHIKFKDIRKGRSNTRQTVYIAEPMQNETKRTQIGVELPLFQAANENGFTEAGRRKFFALATQEFLREKGKFGDHMVKGKFMLFPFLNEYRNLTEQEFLEKENEIMDLMLIEFNDITDKYKELLHTYGILKKDDFVFWSTKDKNTWKTTDNYLKQFITTTFLNNVGFSQLLGLDISIASSWGDFVKRYAGAFAAGPPIFNLPVHAIQHEDTIMHQDANTLVVTSDKRDNLRPIKANDGMVECTAKAWKQIHSSLGQLTSELASALDKLSRDYDPQLTKGEQRALDGIAQKIVQYGKSADGKNTYIKCELALITKQLCFTPDGKPRRGYEKQASRLEHLEKTEKDYDCVAITMPKSSGKLFFDDEASVKHSDYVDNKISFDKFSAGKIIIPGDTFRKQLDNNSKYSDRVSFLRQLVDLVGSQLNDSVTSQGLLNTVRENIAMLKMETFNEAAILTNPANKNEKLWLETLRNNLEQGTHSSHLLDFLQDDYFDLNLPQISSKTKELFVATFRNAFKMKLPGFKATLMSAADMPVLIDEKTKKIITREQQDQNPELYRDTTKYTTRPLAMHSYVEKVDKDGKVIPSTITEGEVMITRRDAALKGINISDPNKKDYMKIISIKSPIQGHYNVLIGTVVDFLPDYYRDTIVGPPGLVGNAGIDFDIDAMYNLMASMYVNSKGKVVKYGEEEGIYEDFEGFIRYQFTYNKLLKRELQKELSNNALAKFTSKYDTEEFMQDDPTFTDTKEGKSKSIIAALLDGAKNDLMESLRIKVLKKFGYPSTRHELMSSGYKHPGVLQNNLFDALHSALKQPENWEFFKGTAEADIQDDLIEKMTTKNIISKDDNTMVPFTAYSITNAFNNAQIGRDLTGFAVNSLTGNSYLLENKVKLSNPFSIGSTIALSYNHNPEVLLKISRYNGGTVAVAVDNAKKLRALNLGLSKETLAHKATAVALGANPETVELMFHQPIIKLIAQNKANKSRPIYPVKTLKKNDAEVLKLAEYNSIIRKSENEIVDIADRKIKEAENEAFQLTDALLEKFAVIGYNPETETDILNHALTQRAVAKLYYDLEKVTKATIDVGIINSYNRGIDSNIEEINSFHEAWNRLTVGTALEPPVFLDMEKTLTSNPVTVANKRHLELIQLFSKSYFISQTDYFESAVQKFISEMDPKTANKIKRKRITQYKDALLTRLMAKAFQKLFKDTVLEGEPLKAYFPYLYGNNSIVKNYNELMKKDADGNFLHPDFANNFFIKNLIPIEAGPKEEQTDVDVLRFDSFTTFSPEIENKYKDSFDDLFRSSDLAVKAFGKKVLIYLLLKDGYNFKNDSFVRYIPASYFKKVSKAMDKVNHILSKEDTKTSANSFKTLIGESKEEFLKNFNILYGSNLANQKGLFTAKTGDFNASVTDSKTLLTKDVVKETAEETGKITLKQLSNDPELLGKTIYKNILGDYDTINFPEMIVRRKYVDRRPVVTLYRLVKSTVNNKLSTAEYVKEEFLRIKGLNMVILDRQDYIDYQVKLNLARALSDQRKEKAVTDKQLKKVKRFNPTGEDTEITDDVSNSTFKVFEGDIFTLPGIPVITTNLGGVHGAGLAQAAKAKGLIKQGDGGWKANSTVVQFPVKKVWSDNMSMNNNMDLLKDSLNKLSNLAHFNPDKTYLLPLVGLGHGEGSIEEILPLLIKLVKSSSNIKLVLPAENVNLGRQGTVRKDYTRENMPKIKAMLSEAGLLDNERVTPLDSDEVLKSQEIKATRRQQSFQDFNTDVKVVIVEGINDNPTELLKDIKSYSSEITEEDAIALAGRWLKQFNKC